MKRIIGTFDWATSNTFTPTIEDRAHIGNEISGTLLASGNHNGVIEEDDMSDIRVVGKVDINGHDYIKKVYDTDGIAPTLTTMGGGNQEPKILEERELSDSEKLITEDGNIKRYLNSDIIDEFKPGQCATLAYPNGYGHGSRVSDLATTILAGGLDKVVKEKSLRIRKLTPKECWRLQGFDDEDYDKAALVNSKAQLYKQAGNSIAVPCLTGIITNIFNVDRENK